MEEYTKTGLKSVFIFCSVLWLNLVVLIFYIKFFDWFLDKRIDTKEQTVEISVEKEVER
jgi:hypothetical protein